MRTFSGTAGAEVDAAPATVFAAITDIDALPDWNAAIECVVSRPAQLVAGASWTVRMHPPHAPAWNSVSTVEVYDPVRLRFRYRTQHANGNPSFVVWSWTVTPRAGGSSVWVSWDCALNTRDRRWIAGPIRKRQLALEVPRSLTELARRTASVTT